MVRSRRARLARKGSTRLLECTRRCRRTSLSTPSPGPPARAPPGTGPRIEAAADSVLGWDTLASLPEAFPSVPGQSDKHQPPVLVLRHSPHVGNWPGSSRLATLKAPLGALAQLGEHCLCKAGVTGSSPVRSIHKARGRGGCGLFLAVLNALLRSPPTRSPGTAPSAGGFPGNRWLPGDSHCLWSGFGQGCNGPFPTHFGFRHEPPPPQDAVVAWCRCHRLASPCRDDPRAR